MNNIKPKQSVAMNVVNSVVSILFLGGVLAVLILFIKPPGRWKARR